MKMTVLKSGKMSRAILTGPHQGPQLSYSMGDGWKTHQKGLQNV